MFFILGFPRSGTTILAQCLSANSQIVVPHETDIAIPAAFVTSRLSDPGEGLRLIADLVTRSKGYDHHIGEFLPRSLAHDLIVGSEYGLSAILNTLYGAIARV